VADFRRAIAGARASGDVDVECMASDSLITGYLMLGELEASESLASELVSVAREHGLGGWEQLGRIALGLARFLHTGEAATAVETMSDVLRFTHLERRRDQAEAVLAIALADLGRTDEAHAVAAQAINDRGEPTRLALTHWAAAEVAWLAGRPRDALVAAECVLDLGLAGFPTMGFGTTIRGWAQLDLGRPVTDGDTGFLPLVAAARPELDGLLALSTGSPARAVELFDRAAQLWRGQFARMELRCRWAAAEAARQADDRSAIDRLLSVERFAVNVDAVSLLPRIHRSLRLAGVTRTAGGSTEPGRWSVTPRQRQILQQVARGRTTREIALQLGVSTETVESQIQTAMRRLGTKTRREAALRVIGDAD
jgi:DNA-binding CsgD family transcriptional regulator